MKTSELTAILKEQLEQSNLTVQALSIRIGELTTTIEEMRLQIKAKDASIDELVATVNSLQELLTQKGIELDKEKRAKKALVSLMEKKSEKRLPQKAIPTTPDNKELVAPIKSKYDPKIRGNNGAKRKEHIECEEEVRDIYPSEESGFDRGIAREFATRNVIRYKLIPMKFRKIIYRIHRFTQNGTVFEGKAPKAPLNNSQFSGSFIAGIAQLRYMYGMPVYRIVKFFNDNGFEIERSTANGLLAKVSGLFDGLYKALKEAVKSDPYLGGDETYQKVLVKDQPNGKNCKKAYLWDVIAHSLGLIYFFYDEGSRSKKVFQNFIKGYSGTFQSDALAAYRELGTETYPDVQRLPCLQHIKRMFLALEGVPDADKIYNLFNELYHQEHKHKIGEKGWTIEDNRKWRQKYAPPILKKIKAALDRVAARKDLPPDNELRKAVNYTLAEWRDVPNIFTGGNFHLDNNEIERFNRYISMSRRSSLFFGSHKGAENAAIYYSLACSCRMHNINFFDYISDLLERAASWSPNTPTAEYRQLLPDKWKPSQIAD